MYICFSLKLFRLPGEFLRWGTWIINPMDSYFDTVRLLSNFQGLENRDSSYGVLQWWYSTNLGAFTNCCSSGETNRVWLRNLPPLSICEPSVMLLGPVTWVRSADQGPADNLLFRPRRHFICSVLPAMLPEMEHAALSLPQVCPAWASFVYGRRASCC